MWHEKSSSGGKVISGVPCPERGGERWRGREREREIGRGRDWFGDWIPL